MLSVGFALLADLPLFADLALFADFTLLADLAVSWPAITACKSSELFSFSFLPK